MQGVTIKSFRGSLSKMTDQPKTQFLPLLLIQLVLIVLFFTMGVYEKPSASSTTVAPAPEGRSEGNQEHEEYSKAEDGLMDVHVMIFIGFGYLMTFLKKYGYSAVGFNLMLSALVVQWALFVQTAIFGFNINKTLFVIKYEALVEADIMAAAILISFGALLGMTSPGQMIFLAFVETVVGCANLYLFTEVFKAEDIGGSVPIHTFGAYFGIGAGIGLNLRKINKMVEANPAIASLNGPTYASDLFAMIGSLFLFIYWPTFNSSLARSPEAHGRAVLNTYLSISASAVVTFVLSSLTEKKGRLDMVHIQNSVLAGGVAIGAIANVNTQPGAALLIGSVIAVISVCGYKYITPALRKMGVIDTCGVNNLHGMPGVFSGLLSILYCTFSESLGSDKSHVYHVKGRSDGDLALYQFLGLLTTIVIGFLSGLLSGLLSTFFVKKLKDTEVYIDSVHWETPTETH